MTNVIEMLDRLANMQAQADVFRMHFDKLRDDITPVIPPEIKAQLDEIEADRTAAIASLHAGITNLETKIKIGVLEAGESVKGTYLHAVWSKGRVSWDTKALDGYAVAHPELIGFRKAGDPSVSIRKV